ncbi:MAG TPA: class I SAM-dependent methyltransferase [Burkholderiales bacterium]|nr:class I SAM-dependent methyltransferase [Burkholderiales bacterium]
MSERDYHDEHYEAEAGLFETPLFRRVHERAAREFLRCTRAGPSHRILSLGCGDGSIERRLAPHVGHLLGVDISPVAISQARAKSAGLANLSFEVAEKLPDGPFDIVAAFAFLHHLDDAAIRETLRVARKALRPGGLFYSSDPSRRRLVGVFRGLVRKTYERYHSPDERELDPQVLARLFTEAGFDRPVIGFADYFLGPLAWLAPGTPAWLAPGVEALDNLALRIPFMRRYASSFYLCAS